MWIAPGDFDTLVPVEPSNKGEEVKKNEITEAWHRWIESEKKDLSSNKTLVKNKISGDSWAGRDWFPSHGLYQLHTE